MTKKLTLKRALGAVVLLALALPGLHPPASAAALPRASAGPAPAEDGLTLARAVEIALAGNPAVLAAQLEMRAAAARRLQAEARPDPALTFSTEGVPYTFRNREGDATEINLGFEQTFEFPGRRGLRTEVARADEDAAALELERRRLVTAGRVKKAYYRTVAAERAAAALERTGSLLEAVIESVRDKYRAGAALYAEVLRAEIEKARLRNRALEEDRERGAAAAELNLLLGRPAGEPLRLLTDLTFIPFVRSLAEVRDAARVSRPSLKIAALRNEQAGAGVRLAALNRLPDLTVGLYAPSIRWNSWGIGAGLSLPLSGKRVLGEREEAAAARDAAALDLAARERRLEALLGIAYAAVQSAQAQVRLFEDKLLAEIEDELKVSLEYYRFGKMESYALLDLHRTYAEARLEHLRALQLYLTSLADLETAGEED